LYYTERGFGASAFPPSPRTAFGPSRNHECGGLSLHICDARKGKTCLKPIRALRRQPAAASPIKSPWVTTGGGFALGLFTTFGVGALFQSGQNAFALTAFGFVSCLVLVIALATTDLAVIKRSDGKVVPVGVLAASAMAAATFALGAVGAAIFFISALYNTQLPARAFYSTTGTAPNGGIEPEILVNGTPTDLSADVNHPKQVLVVSNAWIEVRIRGANAVLQQDNQNATLVNKLLAPAPAQNPNGAPSSGPGED
jgi:hypothetical protein